MKVRLRPRTPFFRSVDDLAYAVMIKKYRRALWIDVNGDTFAKCHRLGMINANGSTAHQFDSEGAKRSSLLKCTQDLFEVIGSHMLNGTSFVR